MDLFPKDVLYEIFLLSMGYKTCVSEKNDGPCKVLMLVCKKWYNILKIRTVRLRIVPNDSTYGYFLFTQNINYSIEHIKAHVFSEWYQKSRYSDSTDI